MENQTKQLATRMVIVVAIALVVIGGVIGFRFHQFAEAAKASASQGVPPVTVSADMAKTATWQPALHATGSLAAVQGVTLSNELAGTIASIDFKSGQIVQKGDLLVQLDIAADEAQLRTGKAAAELARQNLQRAEDLRKSNVNAQSDLDAARATYDEALGNVDLVNATIAKKTIRAPFSGRLGIRQVNLGQYLAAGTSIVTLQSLDPIHLDFALPQQDVVHVDPGQHVDLTLDAFPGVTFEGQINALDPQLDTATRTVRVQATVTNPDHRLLPGMFGTVSVMLPQKNAVVTVPQSAITYNPYGNVVYVIEPGGASAGAKGPSTAGAPLTVHQQFVQLGETRGDQVAVISGLKPGQQIVTSGQLKLREGVVVRIDNSVPPPNSPNPNPPNA